ncbi:hypothetical protein ACLOJK_040845 [Asimina triloba]
MDGTASMQPLKQTRQRRRAAGRPACLRLEDCGRINRIQSKQVKLKTPNENDIIMRDTTEPDLLRQVRWVDSTSPSLPGRKRIRCNPCLSWFG